MPLRVNGETFIVAEPQLNTNVSFEVAGSDTAEYRLTELDKVDPIGRYRFRVADDTLYIQRATAANWADAKNIMTLTPTKLQSNVTIDLTSLVDSGLLANITNLVIDVLPTPDTDSLWLDDECGNTVVVRGPDGYLAITVEDEVVQVPYWRRDTDDR